MKKSTAIISDMFQSTKRAFAFENLCAGRRAEQSGFSAEKNAWFSKAKASAAFTLVEAMVAISILSLAVTGPLLIAQKGIGSAIYARDQITAFYLAQEAIEYVRNVRDSNRIARLPWLSQFSICKDDGNGANGAEKCKIDAQFSNFLDAGAIGACESDICPALSFNTSSKLYGYDGAGGTWVPTIFTRTIAIDDSAGKEALLSVTISWTTTLFTPLRTFTVKEHIFDF